MSPERPARGDGGRGPRRGERGGGEGGRPPRDRDARRDDRRGPPRRDDRGSAPRRDAPRDRPPAPPTPVEILPQRLTRTRLQDFSPSITPPSNDEKITWDEGANEAWKVLGNKIGVDLAEKLRSKFGFTNYEGHIRIEGPSYAPWANQELADRFLEQLREEVELDPTILGKIEAAQSEIEKIDKAEYRNPLLVNLDTSNIDFAIRRVKAEVRAKKQREIDQAAHVAAAEQRRAQDAQRAEADAERAEASRLAAEKEIEQKKIEADNAWDELGKTIGNPAAAATLRAEFGFAQFEKAVASDPRKAQAANKSLKEYLTIALSDDPTFSDAFRGQGRALLKLVEANPFFNGQIDTFFIKQLSGAAGEGGERKAKKIDSATEKRLAEEAWGEFVARAGQEIGQELKSNTVFGLYESETMSGGTRVAALKKTFLTRLEIDLQDKPEIVQALLNNKNAVKILLNDNPFFSEIDDEEVLTKLGEINALAKERQKNRAGETKNVSDDEAWKQFEDEVRKKFPLEARIGTYIETIKLAVTTYASKIKDTEKNDATRKAALAASVEAVSRLPERARFTKNFLFDNEKELNKLLRLVQGIDGFTSYELLSYAVTDVRATTPNTFTLEVPTEVKTKLQDALTLYKTTKSRTDFALKMFEKYITDGVEITAEGAHNALKQFNSKDATKDEKAKFDALAAFLADLPTYKEIAYVKFGKQQAILPADKDFFEKHLLLFLAADHDARPVADLTIALNSAKKTLSQDMVKLAALILLDSSLTAVTIAEPPTPPPPPTPRSAPNLRLVPPLPPEDVPTSNEVSRDSGPISAVHDVTAWEVAEPEDTNITLTYGFILLNKYPSIAAGGISTTELTEQFADLNLEVADLKNLAAAQYLEEIKPSTSSQESSWVWGPKKDELEEAMKVRLRKFASYVPIAGSASEAIRRLAYLSSDAATDQETTLQDALTNIFTSGRNKVAGKELLASLPETDPATANALFYAGIDVQKLAEIWPTEKDLTALTRLCELVDSGKYHTTIKKRYAGLLVCRSQNDINFNRSHIKTAIFNLSGDDFDTSSKNYKALLEAERALADETGIDWLHTPSDEVQTPPPSTDNEPAAPGPQTRSIDITFDDAEDEPKDTDENRDKNADTEAKDQQTMETFRTNVGDINLADRLFYGSGLATFIEVLKTGASEESAAQAAKEFITDYPNSRPAINDLNKYRGSLFELITTNPYLEKTNLTVADIIVWLETTPEPSKKPYTLPPSNYPESPKNTLSTPPEPVPTSTPKKVLATTPTPDTRPATSSTTGNQETTVAKTVMASDTARRSLRDGLNNNELYQRIRHNFGIGEYIYSIQTNVSPEDALASMKKEVASTKIYKLPSKSEILSNKQAITDYLASDPYTKGLTFDMVVDLAVDDDISKIERQKEDALTFMLNENREKFQKGISEKEALQILSAKFGEDAKNLWYYVKSTGKIKETGILFNKKWVLIGDSTVT